MKKRWIALYVENEVGVLAKVSGLFAGKSYNLHSLTVGTTEDETVSRMTIGVKSDDITFEQIKKQFNCMVEVFKVDVALNIAYGYAIPEISAKVQEKVKVAIENMTGLTVADVNIRVAGIEVDA